MEKTQRLPILYVDEASPPARFVMMTAYLLNIKLEIRKINLFAGEHKDISYAKINNLQKVPTLIVEDNAIIDSHAAAIYLCQQVTNQELYPKDNIFTQAKVNELLFFNSGTLFRLDSEIMSSYFAGKWPVAKSKIDEWYNALDYIESKLNANTWLTCDKMYLCDICIMQTISSMLQILPLLDHHKNIECWLQEFEKLQCFDINKRGLARLKYYTELYKPKNNNYLLND
ncbi:glutathione S-transferase E14-like isoform X2 [Pieris rapae]|nr:glutathione S-transferase E14-like isoform X2 [Pieris rapae]